MARLYPSFKLRIRLQPLTSASIIALTLTAGTTADIVTIHDQTFLTSNWTLLNLGGSGVTSMSASRLVGAGVTGDARQITVNGTGSVNYRAENYKTDRPWNPAMDCMIQAISWELWI